jgi:hypothetical protein
MEKNEVWAIRKSRVGAVVCGLLVMWTSSTPSLAAAAISCEFELLKVAHERLRFCGEQIDARSEQRYIRLRYQFARFIRENQIRDGRKSYSQDEKQIRQKLQNETTARVCSDPDHPALRQMFYRYVSEEGMAAVRELLKNPKDPDDGDCF